MEGEGASEDNGRRIKLNPFLQPPVLKAFFEQLPVEDLANCRLANKMWYKESLPIWRNRTSNVTLKFTEEGIVSKRQDATGITSLEEFLDMWEEYGWSSFPFTKFHLHEWEFEIGDVDQERFIELVGEHITSLTLWECSFVDEQDGLQRIMYQAFPNLQFLKMESFGYYCSHRDKLEYKDPACGLHGLKSLDVSGISLPDLEINMLSHFYKLESLHMDASSDLHGDHRELLEIIRLIRAQDQTKLPLKNFHVEFTFELGKGTASSLETLQLHRQLNLPLQCLTFFFPGNTDYNLENKDIVRDILRYHASSLTHLDFQDEWTNPDPHGLCRSFPFGLNFEKLESLCLYSSYCDNLNYLLSTPKLRRLTFGDSGVITGRGLGNLLFANSPKLEIGDWTLPCLTDLTIQLQLSLFNMRKLMRWMPNVERLRAYLNNAKLSIVCDKWQNLKELMDLGRDLTDEGVIGNENVKRAGGAGKEAQIYPNITKLKNLISFGTCSSKLTSASVQHGLLKLANLKKLLINTTLDREVTTAVKGRGIEVAYSG